MHADLPETWPGFVVPLVIAHDVAMARDRSTAVVGGISPFDRSIVGITDFHELPQGQFGSARASALAEIDRQYHRDALIVADLSNDPSYGEHLYETFGPRVIGVHIGRHGEGREFERRPVGRGMLPVYPLGRTYLLDNFHSLLATRMVRLATSPDSRRAYAQLENLKMEMRDTGKVYTCLPGQHDDLAISCCMVAWACRHPDLRSFWTSRGFADRLPRPKPPNFSWKAVT